MKSILEVIPGIGPSIAKDLERIGIHKVSDLKGKSPEKLFLKLCSIDGPTDPCVLYTFRCAVYFASSSRHDKKKLNWWYWKDKKLAS